MFTTNKGINKKDRYLLTVSKNGHAMSELIGKTVTVAAWAYGDKTNADGEMTLKTGIIVDGEAYITNSRSFTERFLDVLGYLEAENEADVNFKLEVIQGTTKSNRHYTTCEYIPED